MLTEPRETYQSRCFPSPKPSLKGHNRVYPIIWIKIGGVSNWDKKNKQTKRFFLLKYDEGGRCLLAKKLFTFLEKNVVLEGCSPYAVVAAVNMCTGR